ncbi:nicotinate-nucleotide--dimethylbenzimidazole phosphoribosyltransferase [Synergistales bacterium]|nr:nicotinate-nucleotide--dimethylbenzimidazole phosphoribosyltransferase [Synergistales bacterium]
MFFLFISGTDLSRMPGLTAAGASPDVIPFTSPADADLIRFGYPEVIDCFPMDPEGRPTPAVITRAVVVETGMPVCVIRAGSYLPPATPYIELASNPGHDPRLGQAVYDAKKIFKRARHLSNNICCGMKSVTLAESIPGGTTTALLVLRALGIDGMVSSGGSQNPIYIKERVWKQSSFRSGMTAGSARDTPLDAIMELGDPMQAAVAGFAAGLDDSVEVVLAGGTQMIAVAAVIKKLIPSRKLLVATTKYVTEDASSSFNAMAETLGVETYAAPLDFTSSPHRGLRDYEQGYVKEGAGAGGAVLYAERNGVSAAKISEATNMLYSDLTKREIEVKRFI